MARRRIDGEVDEFPPIEPDPEPQEPPAPDTGEVDLRLREISEARFRWAKAVDYWHIANEESAAQRFGSAEMAYEASQQAVVRYFEKFYTSSSLQLAFNIVPGTPIAEQVGTVVTVLFDKKDALPALWAKVRRRREAITLEELQKPDWGGFSTAAEALLRASPLIESAEQSTTRQQSLDYFALILATVFIPLARADMNRRRRNLDAAIEDYERLLTPYRKPSPGAPLIWLTCDVIERPFILLALGETRMEKAEVRFKAASQGKADEARTTYQSILKLFKDHGAYVTRVASAQKRLTDEANKLPQLPPDRKAMALQILGKDITVPGIKSKTKELPGLSQTKAPAESWLQFQDTVNGEVIAETNPRIYALLLSAQARLLQIKHGFNYIGYKDDYIPPWRFQFLLERARYFSEHAKNAQRDYLNFLNNAEQEEFQEKSMAQAVEMEKANMSIESARVDQVNEEIKAALKSEEQMVLVANNALQRRKNYRAFDHAMNKLEEDSFWGSIGFGALAVGAVAASIAVPGSGVALLSAVSGAKIGSAAVSAVGDVFSTDNANSKASVQRDLEKKNLELAYQ